MNNAMRNRQTAIGMLSELYMPYDPDGASEYLYDYCNDTLAPAHDVADNIEKLAQLGRTARWQAAIDTWARSVREHGSNPKSLRWAFLQGMINASHASE